MKTVVLLFHPTSIPSKVNKRLAEEAAKLDNVTVVDEYQRYPDFKVDAKREQEQVADADRIVFQFPMYWYSSPSLLKEWQDVVLEYGWAYGSTGDKLHGKELLVAISTGGPLSEYAADGEVGHTVEEILLPFRCMAQLTGLKWDKPFVTGGALAATDEQVDAEAKEYAARLR